ncbi:MAG: hypothetical protein CL816_01390 [Coxiellaceae bacterium]|nr:hypothetical protein [Coxiellaceae bacterium]
MSEEPTVKSPITSINQHQQPAYDHRYSAIDALSLTVFELDMELCCRHIESINDQLFSQDNLALDAWQHCLTSSSSYNYLSTLRSWLVKDTSPNTFQQVISIHSTSNKTVQLNSTATRIKEHSAIQIIWQEATPQQTLTIEDTENGLLDDISFIIDNLERGEFNFKHDSFYRYHPIIKRCYGLTNTLQTVNEELIRLSQEVGQEGKLGGRAYGYGIAGGWKKLLRHVNSMADNLTLQVREVSAVALAVAEGDLSQKMHGDVKGEVLSLKETLNTMVDQLNLFYEEVNRVAFEVGTEGTLGGQADVPGVKGKWKQLTSAVNVMAGNLTTQVRDMITVSNAVANGDLSQKITVDAQGEVLQFKTIVNNMVDNLRHFSQQVMTVARAIGEEGLLGQNAHVPRVNGCWSEITQHVNAASDQLTQQVRSITYFAQQLSDGMLDASLEFDSPGEINDLVNSLLKMQHTLQSTAEQANAITQGDYNDFTPQSAHDELGQMLVTMTQTLEAKTSRLQSSEQILNEFIQYSEDMFFRLDEQFHILFISDSFEKLMQESRSNWIGKCLHQWSPSLTHDFIEELLKSKQTQAHPEVYIQDAFRLSSSLNESHFNQVIHKKTPHGILSFDIALWPVLNDSNSIKEYHLMARNITQNYQVFHRNQFLFHIQNESPVLHLVIDIDTQTVAYSNKAFQKRTGALSKQNTIHIQELHSEEELTFVTKIFVPEVLKNGKWEGYKSMSLPNTQEEILKTYSYSTRIDSQDGKTYISCAMLDITQQIKNEKRLNEQETLIASLEKIQDSSPCLYFITDADTSKIIYRNQAAKNLLNHKSNHSSKDCYISDYHNDEEMRFVASEMIPIIKETGSWSGRINMTICDNKTLATEATVYSFIEPKSKKTYYSASFRDITGDLLVEKNEQLHQEQLDRVLRLSLASEVGSGIAHQVNQPLACLSSTLQHWQSQAKGNTDFLQKEIKNTLPKLIELTEEMGRTIHRVKDLLTDNTSSEPTKFNIHHVLSSLCYEYKQSHTKVAFTTSNNPHNDKYTIKTSRTFFELALRNIINNAIEAMHDAQTQNPEVTFFITQTSDQYCVYVCDNGPGIEPSLYSKIFQPFFSTKTDGTGTGLSLIARLCESHNELSIKIDEAFKEKNNIKGACFCLSVTKVMS